MPEMWGLTLSGVDAWTDLDALASLSVETGLLYSHSRPGDRYPDYDTLVQLVDKLPNPALHICGRGARDEMAKRSARFLQLSKRVRRIQVNGLVCTDELRVLHSLYPGHTIITQHCAGNAELAQSWHPRHALLVDQSGGRGILPDCWDRPDTQRPVGFAGGLSPSNLLVQLHNIRALNRGYSGWVDLESGLRTDDKFDFQKALSVVDTFSTWKREFHYA